MNRVISWAFEVLLLCAAHLATPATATFSLHGYCTLSALTIIASYRISMLYLCEPLTSPPPFRREKSLILNGDSGATK